MVHRRYIEVISVEDNQLCYPHLELIYKPWDNVIATKESILSTIEAILKPVYLEASENLERLFQEFETGQVVAVSDGSYFSETQRAAAAWIIESSCRTQWIRGSMLTPGPLDNLSAYRSELTGLLAITVSVKTLSVGLSPPKHVIKGCDGKAALQVLKSHKADISANLPHSDLRSTVVDIWSSLTTLPFPVHIWGHQDDHAGHTLNRLEVLNISMDKLATLTASSFQNPGESFGLPSIGLPRVKLHATPISGGLQRRLYTGMVTKKLDKYMIHKILQDTQDLEIVAMESFEKARSQAPVYMNIFITKWISNTLATGVVMQTRKQRIFNRCPRCNAWGEDKIHVVTCWDTRAQLIWKRQMTSFRQFLINENTSPEVAEYLLSTLQEFRAHPNTAPTAHKTWQQELNRIGWINVLTGFLGRQHINRQSEYYKHIGCRKTGARWGSRVILQWWNIIHKLWLGRNDVLHTKEVINTLSGQALLDIEIEREYDAGYDDLPIVVHKWFLQLKEQLMARSTDYKKGWLLIVKTMKESMQIAEYSLFSSSVALRRWIGLREN